MGIMGPNERSTVCTTEAKVILGLTLSGSADSAFLRLRSKKAFFPLLRERFFDTVLEILGPGGGCGFIASPVCTPSNGAVWAIEREERATCFWLEVRRHRSQMPLNFSTPQHLTSAERCVAGVAGEEPAACT